MYNVLKGVNARCTEDVRLLVNLVKKVVAIHRGITIKAKFFRLSHDVVMCDVGRIYITRDYIVRQTKKFSF